METTHGVTQPDAGSFASPSSGAADTGAVAVRQPQSLELSPRPASELDRVVAFEARKKSMAMAYLLWWIFGAFGGHRFYLGRTGSATTMLCITLVSIPLMFVVVGVFTFLVTAVWALVDAFLLAGWVRAHNAEVARSLGAVGLAT